MTRYIKTNSMHFEVTDCTGCPINGCPDLISGYTSKQKSDMHLEIIEHLKTKTIHENCPLPAEHPFTECESGCKCG